MSERQIFNRRYQPFQSDGTTVYLTTGVSQVTSPGTSIDVEAGETLIPGTAVFAFGTPAQIFKATAISGVTLEHASVVGFTQAGATVGGDVGLTTTGIVAIPGENVVGETQLTTGDAYFLSKFDGQITKYSTTSGLIQTSEMYQAVAPVGVALSPTELSVNISNVTLLTS